MAKGIVLSLQGEVSSFGLCKVERDKLYGKKDRLVVDETGATCVAAHLTADGAAVIPPGGTAYLYVDPSFTSVERSEMKAVDDKGQPLTLVPSTLGVEQPLSGPVEPTRVLDHVISSVYELAPETLGLRLKEALDAGQIFESRFNWREDYADAPLFILKNEQGFFALVGTPSGFKFLERAAPVVVDEGEGETLADELDFSMM